jgi:hypothetical protein
MFFSKTQVSRRPLTTKPELSTRCTSKTLLDSKILLPGQERGAKVTMTLKLKITNTRIATTTFQNLLKREEEGLKKETQARCL